MSNIFTRIFRKNAPGSHANMPLGTGVNVWGTQSFFHQPLVGKYSDLYFWSIVNKIYNGMRNVRFINLDMNSLVDDVRDFLNREHNHIIWNYWKDGVVVIDVTDELAVVDDFKYTKDGGVEVPQNHEYIVYYSIEYRMRRMSAFKIIHNELMMIDKFGSALDFLTSTYGSVCLISGGAMPMNTADKEDINRQLKTNLGITADKNQFIVSQGKDLQMQQFSFDLDGLDLQGKLDKQYLLLADFFNVPKNILTTDTDSTYENQQAALKRFYTDCITPLAEVVLEIGRMIIRNSLVIVSSEELSFTFDNTDVVDDKQTTLSNLTTLHSLVQTAPNEDIRTKLINMINDIIDNEQ